MTTTTTPPAKINAFEKYASVLLPAIILLFGDLQSLEKAPNWVNLITFFILVAGLIGTYVVPLLDAKWAGVLKTSIPILTAVLSALVPLIVNHEISVADVPLIVVAVLQAIVTELGNQVRVNAMIDAGTATPGVASTITNVPPAS